MFRLLPDERDTVNMMPMFLTVYLSNNEQHFSEVPITPETLCRDVVELCKEPGEADCYLAQVWRGSEHVVGEGERMLEVLQRGGQQRGEVRYLLRHQRAPGPETGGSRAADQMVKRNQLKASLENGVSVTLSDLQDLATRQQQQINTQQQLLATKEQRLRQLKDHQEASETERLQQLRENAHNQEAKLRRVRALRGQVEQKRLSNSKLVEEIDQMSGLFQLKQRELLLAVSRVEELSEQLESLRSNRLEPPLPPPPPHLHHHNTSSTAELERLYKELQLRNKLNQDQSGRLQQQRDSLNKRNLEAAAMDRRLAELRQRLWKKKAALQQKENLPVCSDGAAPQHGVGSRVAAVGPYIQSSSTGSQGPPVPARQDLLVKPAYPDGTATLPMPDSALKPPPIPAKPAAGFSSKMNKLSDWSGSFSESAGAGFSHASTLPRMSSLGRHTSGGKALTDQRSLSGSEVPPPVPSRTNHIAENLLRDNQFPSETLGPPPVPSKPKPFSPSGFSTPPYSTGTFPGKARPLGGHLRAPGVLSSHSRTLPLPAKQENPPAAAVRPYTPDPSEAPPPVLQKPQTVAASSIYSMYTQQGKGYQPGGQGTLPRSQPRVYGKPVLPASGGQLSATSDVIHSGSAPDASEVDSSFPANGEGSCSGVVVAETAERATPRPLSPTKLLPFLSHPHRNPTLHHAPRPLKKRSSITEPEGPAGPNIQKLLYQKTTLAAMETIPMETLGPAGVYVPPPEEGTGAAGADPMPGVDDMQPRAGSPEAPPPLPPRSPLFNPASCRYGDEEEEEGEGACPPTSAHRDFFADEFPPYPPPPYPSCGDGDQADDPPDLQPPEVTGQVAAPPGKKSILRRAGSERTDPSVRVKFNPLALLLDSSLEGEYDLVQRVIYDVDDPSMPNDEGITALHNAVCAGHTEIVKFLVQFGVNANAADSDGWTPLHCAASCNNVQVCKFLVESGAAVFATTHSDMQTAADKCEEMEDGYAQCSQFLYGVQEKMGVMNRGVVYALWDYEPQSEDELGFREGDCMTVLRREDAAETEWWWARCGDHEGYIPRNLLGLYLRIKPRQRSLA
ncbi:apoptosis-stimulating of p53 protein 2-like isoform X2 [Sander lucioperca]|uniref:apoptosis-stimulating of p53 protein 2-like isoform X2 n=1 Tax=Sander lucioperca TaxID=283035 RepID=UPI0016538FE4|nr:apoptosis-stimulating of p53 protein 2-like isoform X2 [Sander lucioperca]